MILPIVAYGSPVLRNISRDIDIDYPQLTTLIEDMWETMYRSNGVGLAAPQINRQIRLFVIDTIQIFANDEDGETKSYPDAPGANIDEVNGKNWSYNEGCLSIPKIREDIERKDTVTLTFLDENFQQQTRSFNGITGRVILHEYDHIEGKLFIDYLKPLKRTLIRRKLDDISKGKIKVDYRMLFPK